MGERKRARRSSREENRGTAQIPPLSLSLSSTLPIPTRQSKNTGRRGREKEGAGGARNPNPSPKSWSNLSIRGASGSDRVGGFGGRSHEREGVRIQGAQRQAQEGPAVAPCSSPFSEYFRRSGPRAAALIDKRIEGESVFVCG